MCLFIESEKLIAKEPIVVFKCLDYNRENKTYETPFQYFPVRFDADGVARLFVDKRKFKPKKVRGFKQINVGIHAFINIEQANYTSYMFPQTATHYAVIPKGAIYYLGGQEIASNELIIFKRKKDYREFKKKDYKDFFKEE